MSNKPRTPAQLLEDNDRKTYSFSLNKRHAEQLKRMAEKAGLPFSALIDEAIKSYLEATKER